ncbi:hypothetical protein L1049_023323 [Liquidambar formosana]|uniref:Uncharacterized protein n=1 Tax=Liquidambar formosana TaxID=63359 RepID=A0AAP0X411_LIQFO
MRQRQSSIRGDDCGSKARLGETNSCWTRSSCWWLEHKINNRKICFHLSGSCCRAPTVPEPPEEETTLVPLTCAGSGSGRGRAARSRGNGLSGYGVDSSKQWRPALSVISEDGSAVSALERNGVRAVRTEKKPAGKVGSKPRDRVPNRGDEYRKAPMPMVIPAFSPTPFMF